VRKKALDKDLLGYLTMLICYELGKTEEEVKEWKLSDIYRWVAFFRLKGAAEARAYEQARKDAGKKSKMTTY
jgi:hypothetical protein